MHIDHANLSVYLQAYSDNSGVGALLSQYLQDTSERGQLLTLIINELGDHQMTLYFNSDGSTGGMACEGEGGMDDEVFKRIKDIHRKSFEELGGEYIERDDEKTCAVRMPSIVFFEVPPGLVSVLGFGTAGHVYGG